MHTHLDFQSVYEKYDREATLDTVQSLTKITARAISFAGYFNTSPELVQSKEVVAGIQAVFTIRSTFNSVGKIINHLTKNDDTDRPELAETLKAASATVGIASGLLSIFKFCLSRSEILKLLSGISSSLGGTSVVGETLFKSLFLNHIASALGLLQSLISITVDSIYIHERNKQIAHSKEKIALWNQPLNAVNLDLKIQRMDDKQAHMSLENDRKILKFASINQKAKNAIQAYADQKALFEQEAGLKKIYSWCILKAKKRKADRKIIKHLDTSQKLNHSLEKHLLALSKLNGLKKIQAKWDYLTDGDTQKITAFSQDKTQKWETKQKSLKIEQIKAAFGLTLKVIGLVMTIAALILSSTGVGLIPVLITMSTVSLALAVISLGFALFKRHTSPLPTQPVPPPSLA